MKKMSNKYLSLLLALALALFVLTGCGTAAPDASGVELADELYFLFGGQLSA